MQRLLLELLSGIFILRQKRRMDRSRWSHLIRTLILDYLKWWYPQTIHFSRVFHYKPSILGYPYFWKHPYIFVKFLATHACESKVTRFLAACTWSKHDISRVRVAISNKDSQEAYTSFSLKIQIPKSQCILSTQKDVQQTSFLPSSLSSMAPWSLQRWPGCLQQNLCTEQKKKNKVQMLGCRMKAKKKSSWLLKMFNWDFEEIAHQIQRFKQDVGQMIPKCWRSFALFFTPWIRNHFITPVKTHLCVCVFLT